MRPRISSVRALANYHLDLCFTNGAQGQVDLRDWIVGQGGVFAALEDPGFFNRVSVNQELGTVVWPNGVDFCPDVLYSRIAGQQSQMRQPA